MPPTPITPAALNAPDPQARLDALQAFFALPPVPPPMGEEVNNHVHTCYSFSPYSPTMAAWMARQAGLAAVGIVDHDTLAGADELSRACAIVGIGSTVGCELRVNASGTRIANRLINGPDLPNIFYLVLHGIPRNAYSKVTSFIEPIRASRATRNQRQLERLNRLIGHIDMPPLDWQEDVVAHSQWQHGGSITERHLIDALARRLIATFGYGAPLIGALSGAMALHLPPTTNAGLLQTEGIDSANPHSHSATLYRYRLIGLLKSALLPRFLLLPDEIECPPAASVVRFGLDIGAIPAYAYLGAQDNRGPRFEDDYLGLLMDEIVSLGFPAITYMPPRNSLAQLERVRSHCRRLDLMEISGVDINSPLQSFTCPEVLRPEFRHLITATWALIAHQQAAQIDPKWALFDPHNPWFDRPLRQRIRHYATIGQRMHDRQAEAVASALGKEIE